MSDKVSTPPALLAPFLAVGREFSEIFRNRTAVLGGVAGTGAIMAGAAALVMFGPAISDAATPEDDELVMEFMPGALVKIGVKVDEQAIPEKVIVDATQAAAAAAPQTVTDDEKQVPVAEPDKPKKPKDRVVSTEKPDPNRNGEKISDKNRPGNNPYKDPATMEDMPGDPFGSPNGWADMAKDGDPWATAVLAALNGMTVGSYAGLGQEATYKFQLVVCADGRVDDVRTKKSTGKPDFDGQIRNALESLKLPKAPADIAKQLAGGCKKIPYEFTWSGKSKNGTVK